MIAYTVFRVLLLSFLLIDHRFLAKCSPKKYRAPQPPNQQTTQSDIDATIIPTKDETDLSTDINQVIFVSPDGAPERPSYAGVISSTDSEEPSLTSLVQDAEPVKTDETEIKHKTGIDLDVENMYSRYYSYKKDGYIVTYTAKSEYLFTLVKRYSTVIWKAKNPREYSNEVVFDCVMKRVTIFQLDGNKKIFQSVKSGCCSRAKWEEIVEISG